MVAVDAQVVTDLRARARAGTGASASAAAAVPIAPEASTSTLHSSWTCWPVGARVGSRSLVVHHIGGHDVAVGAGAGLRDRLDLEVGQDLHAGVLGRPQVVGDQRVLGAEDAAGVAPLGVDAALARRSPAGRGRRCGRRRPASPPTARRTWTPAPRSGARHAQPRLGARVVRVERRLGRSARGHIRRSAGRRRGGGRAARRSRAGAAARRPGTGWSRRRRRWRSPPAAPWPWISR